MEQLYNIIWVNNSPPGKFITLLIITAGMVAWLCARRHTRRYKRDEPAALDLVRRRLKIEVEANPNKMIPLEKLYEPVKSGASLIADRLAAIAKLRQVSVKVSVNSLQQMSLLKESSNLSLAIPAYVTGLAMMLGLLGAFIGLALMAQEIQMAASNIRATSLPAIRNNLSEITRGLKTGFSTSLIGLACSITVSWLNLLLARAQSRFYDELERFTTEDLLPKTVPAVEGDSLLEEVTHRLNNGFARIETITHEHTQNVERLQSVEEAFGKIIENIKNITHHEANAGNVDFIGGVTNVIQQMTQVNQAVVALTQQVPRITADFQKTQKETLQELSKLLNTQRDRTEAFFKAQQTRPQGPSAASRSVTDFIRYETPESIKHGFRLGKPRLSDIWDTAKLFIIAILAMALLMALLYYWLQ
jgi:hypothetical protein